LHAASGSGASEQGTQVPVLQIGSAASHSESSRHSGFGNPVDELSSGSTVVAVGIGSVLDVSADVALIVVSGELVVVGEVVVEPQSESESAHVVPHASSSHAPLGEPPHAASAAAQMHR